MPPKRQAALRSETVVQLQMPTSGTPRTMRRARQGESIEGTPVSQFAPAENINIKVDDTKIVMKIPASFQAKPQQSQQNTQKKKSAKNIYYDDEEEDQTMYDDDDDDNANNDNAENDDFEEEEYGRDDMDDVADGGDDFDDEDDEQPEV